MNRVRLCLFLLILATQPNCPAEENAPQLKAGDVLAPALLKSSVHSVGEKVDVDRYAYRFDVETAFGRYSITSKEMLKIRVNEFQVLARAKDINGMEQFSESMKDSVVQIPVAVVDTVFNPIDSVKRVGAGARGKFSAVGRFIGSGREKSDYEDNSIKEASIGSHKRALAMELGLDVYSTNPKVQKLLNHLARARALGTLPVRVGGMLAPPGVGLALAVVRLRKDISSDLREKSASELHAMNNAILKELAIDGRVRDAFNDNGCYSPRHRTAIAANLDAMRDVKGLTNFLATTLNDTTEEEALFAERQADMLLIYHRQIENIDSIGRVGNLAVAITKDSKLVVAAPIDYVYADPKAEDVLSNLSRIAQENGFRAKKLVISGTISSEFKNKLHKNGFDFVENFGGAE